MYLLVLVYNQGIESDFLLSFSSMFNLFYINSESQYILIHESENWFSDSQVVSYFNYVGQSQKH